MIIHASLLCQLSRYIGLLVLLFDYLYVQLGVYVDISCGRVEVALSRVVTNKPWSMPDIS